jgi:hypothetical protein
MRPHIHRIKWPSKGHRKFRMGVPHAHNIYQTISSDWYTIKHSKYLYWSKWPSITTSVPRGRIYNGYLRQPFIIISIPKLVYISSHPDHKKWIAWEARLCTQICLDKSRWLEANSAHEIRHSQTLEGKSEAVRMLKELSSLPLKHMSHYWPQLHAAAALPQGMLNNVVFIRRNSNNKRSVGLEILCNKKAAITTSAGNPLLHPP